MNRALPLLILIAAIAGGLGYVALQAPGPAENNDHSATRDAVDDDSTATTVAPSSDGLAPVTSSDPTVMAATATMWDIIPMTLKGQLIRGAHITAKRTGETRSSDGRTKWIDAAEGPWELTIESEDSPTWRRTVTLVAGAKTRTIARLGAEIRIDGTILDCFGEPVANERVYFLPRGTLHPTRAVASRGKALPAARTRQIVRHVSATTDASGKFRIDVPEAGAWRLSVGQPNAARWTQNQTADLSHGGPEKVTAIIPALASVLFDCPDEPAARPSVIRAYHYDAVASAQLEADTHAKESILVTKVTSKGGDSDGASGFASDGGNSSVRSGSQPFPPGWMMFKTLRVSPDGTAEFRDLAEGEELRFLFLRKGERMVTAGSYRFAAGKQSHALVSLPAPGSVIRGAIDERASLKVSLIQVEAQPVGTDWSY